MAESGEGGGDDEQDIRKHVQTCQLTNNKEGTWGHGLMSCLGTSNFGNVLRNERILRR